MTSWPQRPPIGERPLVLARIVDRRGAVRHLPGTAISWVGQAVMVELSDGGSHLEVWLHASDVTVRGAGSHAH